MSAAAAARPGPPWPFLLHVNQAAGRAVADGGRGDPDLVLHYLVTRDSGLAITGQPVDAAIGAVPSSAGAAAAAGRTDLGDGSGRSALCRAQRLSGPCLLAGRFRSLEDRRWCVGAGPRHRRRRRGVLPRRSTGGRDLGRPTPEARAFVERCAGRTRLRWCCSTRGVGVASNSCSKKCQWLALAWGYVSSTGDRGGRSGRARCCAAPAAGHPDLAAWAGPGPSRHRRVGDRCRPDRPDRRAGTACRRRWKRSKPSRWSRSPRRRPTAADHHRGPSPRGRPGDRRPDRVSLPGLTLRRHPPPPCRPRPRPRHAPHPRAAQPR